MRNDGIDRHEQLLADGAGYSGRIAPLEGFLVGSRRRLRNWCNAARRQAERLHPRYGRQRQPTNCEKSIKLTAMATDTNVKWIIVAK